MVVYTNINNIPYKLQLNNATNIKLSNFENIIIVFELIYGDIYCENKSLVEINNLDHVLPLVFLYTSINDYSSV